MLRFVVINSVIVNLSSVCISFHNASSHSCFRFCLTFYTRFIIIIKRISRAPIYHTRWQHRALYNNNNHTHTHIRARARTHAHTHARTHTHTHARTHTHTHARARARAHARTHARTHAHTVSEEGMGRAVKNSLEIIIKQVRLEGGFERGGRQQTSSVHVHNPTGRDRKFRD